MNGLSKPEALPPLLLPPPVDELELLLELEDELELLEELELEDELELLEELELEDEELELEDEVQLLITPPLPPWLSQVVRPIQL